MAYRFLRAARPLSNLRPSTPLIATTRAASNFASSPAPPRLPAEEQAEFERLQRTANTQQGFNPSSTPTPEPSITVKTATTTPAIGEDEGSTIQPNVPLRKGAPPEFEGETNPKTGEVGGPKNEPLRWGAAGDYSFNGRVTDF